MFFKSKNNGKKAINSKLVDSTYIIVGLGNIGSQYAGTRHNAGFMAVDRIAEKYRLFWKNSKFQSEIADFNFRDKKVILAKPTTLMNLSGLAVSKLVNFYKIPLENLMIIYDDVDISLGKARIRETGTAGTHNGMKSIVQQLGSKDFPRFRVGIGPKPEFIDMINFVMGKFPASEEKLLDGVFDEAVEAVEDFVNSNLQAAMTKINTKK